MDPQRARKIWRKANPRNLLFAPWVPMMVVLETTGRRSGLPRQVPLAKGPIDGDVAWLISVLGERSDYAHNIAADPRVRLQIGRTWRTGTASMQPMDLAVRARFSRFARWGPRCPSTTRACSASISTPADLATTSRAPGWSRGPNDA